MQSLAFDFGSNWKAFSEAKLSSARLEAAKQSLCASIGLDRIRGRSFLDIGCGSGLFSIAAAECGAARVFGFDINPISVKVADSNLLRLAPLLTASAMPSFCVGNSLDEEFLSGLGCFDIVYAWGVLHHTGAMWDAIRQVAGRVVPNRGVLVIAIYNRHWTSGMWKQIKRLYNLASKPCRALMNYLFGALIYLALWVTTGQNPLKKERGMDFWYDVIDWLGGYPYEYATVGEVVDCVRPLGLRLERVQRPRGWTGCNEFVFVHEPPTGRDVNPAERQNENYLHTRSLDNGSQCEIA